MEMAPYHEQGAREGLLAQAAELLVSAEQQEKAFAFTLFATSSSVKVEPLNGGRIDTGAAGVTSKRVPPSAPTYKSDAAKVAPPKASGFAAAAPWTMLASASSCFLAFCSSCAARFACLSS